MSNVAVTEQVHSLLHKLDKSLPEGYQPFHEHDHEEEPSNFNLPGSGIFGTGGGQDRTAEDGGSGGIFDFR